MDNDDVFGAIENYEMGAELGCFECMFALAQQEHAYSKQLEDPKPKFWLSKILTSEGNYGANLGLKQEAAVWMSVILNDEAMQYENLGFAYQIEKSMGA